MGTTLSTALPWDPLDIDHERNSLLDRKSGAFSPSTSTSSLTSTVAPLPTPAVGLAIMGSNAPLLYEHALVGDWTSLLQRIETHPHEAHYRDKCQNMCLHVSCRRQPPPRVVDALIRANPEALFSPTLDGLTPLHFGCFCGSSPETIELVVGDETHLRNLVDRRGRTPLHCVCAGFRSPHRLDVVRMLLELDPSCATATDERHRTPLSLIVEDYAEEFQDSLQGTAASAALATTLPGGDLHECWQIITLLLRAAYAGTLEDNVSQQNEVHVGGKFRLLHAAAGVPGCPAVITRLLLRMHPHAARQKDGDLHLPLHLACKTVGQPWSRKIVNKTKRGVVVYNADFGQKLPKDDVTAEILQANPDAARVADENGKLPFVLAVESGKPWETSLKPLWETYKIDDFLPLQEAVDEALTAASDSLRKEIVKTLGHLAPLCPDGQADGWLNHMIEFAREAPCRKDEAWFGTMQASALDGLARLLEHVNEESVRIPETPQQALDLSLPLLSHCNEQVRTSSARVLGAAVKLLGPAAAGRALKDVVFAEDEDEINDDGSLSTMGHSCTDETTVESLHGRAMACHFILEGDNRSLTIAQIATIKEWVKHECVTVRRAACLTVGSILSSSNDLREYRSGLLKCMRATEDSSVHLNLAKALANSARRHDKLYLCKAGLPLLDGALMLSMSRATPQAVQRAFHVFLWFALQKNEDGLQKYMSMAEGENGRIMMSLVNRILARLPIAEECSEGDHVLEMEKQRQQRCTKC